MMFTILIIVFSTLGVILLLLADIFSSPRLEILALISFVSAGLYAFLNFLIWVIGVIF